MDIYLDFETRSELDLKKVGAFKYMEHSSTDILCLAYIAEGQKTKFWTPDMLMHKPAWELFTRPDVRLYAWNATFDLLVWEKLMHGKYNWPKIPDGRWYDVQACASAKGYPADLESASPALGLSGHKLSGTSLLKLFSTYDIKKGGFTYPNEEPEKFQDLLLYCERDVLITKMAHEKLGDLPQDERRVWLHTLKINRRGVSIDSGACRNVIGLIEQKREILNNGIAVHTAGVITKVTQRERIKKWLQDKCGLPMENMQGSLIETVLQDIDNALNDTVPDDVVVMHHPKRNQLIEAKILLTWYLVGNKSSIAKYQSMLNFLCFDRTVKGFLFYHGAGTGRYSGRGVQFQNFPNKTLDNADDVIDCLHEPDLKIVELTIGDILDASKKLLRSMIVAPAGKYLCVADYKSIEMVAVAWACSEKELLQAFVRGLDQYRLMASKMYDVDYAMVTDEQRFAGKIAVLACGFGGGENAILGMATKMRMQVGEEQARLWTGQFRKARPALRNAWDDVEKTAKRALIGTEGQLHDVASVRGMAFTLVGNDLRIVMPSGRRINYPNALVRSTITTTHNQDSGHKWKTVHNMAADWVDSTTHKWTERNLYGSLMFQNYIQGLCRDILTAAQLRLEAKGFPIVINVHDELGGLVDDDSEYTYNRFKSVMTQRPQWLPMDFPVLADGYIAKRYRK